MENQPRKQSMSAENVPKELMQDYHAMLATLFDDVNHASLAVGRSATQCNIRTLARAIFAFIEGDTYARKSIALDFRGDVFSDAEKMLLREEQPALRDNGAVVLQSSNLRCLDNLRFSFRACSKATGFEFKADLSGDGWAAMRSALAIRHRITHPKNSASLTITLEEAGALAKAYNWYKATVTQLLRDMATAAENLPQ